MECCCFTVIWNNCITKYHRLFWLVIKLLLNLVHKTGQAQLDGNFHYSPQLGYRRMFNFFITISSFCHFYFSAFSSRKQRFSFIFLHFCIINLIVPFFLSTIRFLHEIRNQMNLLFHQKLIRLFVVTLMLIWLKMELNKTVLGNLMNGNNLDIPKLQLGKLIPQNHAWMSSFQHSFENKIAPIGCFRASHCSRKL